MADGIEVRVLGVHELQAALDKLVVQAGEAARAATMEAGRLLAADAAKRAPKRSGALARSILVIPTGSSSVMVGPSAVYGRRVEFGFHGADSLGRHYNEPGHPFLRPAEAAAAELYPRLVAARMSRIL